MRSTDPDDWPVTDSDRHWLAVGLRLGLERPDDARRLLARLEPASSAPGGAAVVDAATAAAAAAGTAGPAGAAGDGGSAAATESGQDSGSGLLVDAEESGSNPDPDFEGGPHGIPATSMLLVRSAAMPPDQRAEVGPEVVFGWAARLTTSEITSMGRTVQHMLDSGSPADVGRGFGIAWSAGVRLPMGDLDAMFREFVDLEYTVGSVFAGRDLRHSPPPAEAKGFGAMFAGWLGRSDPATHEVGAVIDGAGRPAQLGLVALWNAWVGIRYRASIPAPTLELLLRPWVAVVGPIPDA